MYDFRILVQIYQSVIKSQKAVKKVLESQKNENTQTSEVNSKFFSKIC